MASQPPSSNGIHGSNGAQSSASSSQQQATRTASDLSLDEARARALELGQQRAAIDAELQTLGETLRAQNATMSSPLIDAEGFPLANIDIVAVRTARARIIALRNDRNNLESQMREFVTAALARPPGAQGSGSNTAASSSQEEAQRSTAQLAASGQAMAHVPGTQGALSMSVPTRPEGDASAWGSVGGLQPFARVNAVANGSPAMQAGMQADDEVLQFGDLTASTAHRNANDRDLGNLPMAVQEGNEITVIVLRRSDGPFVNGNRGDEHHEHSPSAERPRVIKRLRLTPASGWGGRGLLGCHLLPVR